MTNQILSVFLLIIASVLSVHCYQISFLDHCLDGSAPETLPSIGKKSSGSIIMAKAPENGSWYPSDLNCSVTISAEKSYLLLLTFSNVSLRNSNMDNLTIDYNSGKSSVVLSGQQVCSNENCEGLKFDSGDFNTITLKFRSAPNVTVPKNVTGFRAHYTVFDKVGENGACKDKKMFLCDNTHCIWNGLICDGHNNCGDSSDETSCDISIKDTVWGIVTIVVAASSLIILVPIFICLATYGTKNIVKTIKLSSLPTPLVSTVDCGEASGLLTSSEVVSNCWPGTSYERRNSFSYGTSHENEPSEQTDKKKFRSMSEAPASRTGKFL